MRTYIPYAVLAASFIPLAGASWIWWDAQKQLAEANDVRAITAVLMREAAKTNKEMLDELERQRAEKEAQKR